MRAHICQEARYAHSVRVARLAERLAMRHGLDPARARTAGLLHDLARLYDGPRLVAECEARAMPIDAFERRNPILLHARLGAELAAERFGIDDSGVLSAIGKHTVAALEMSPLDTIVYLADGLEPGRDFPERAALEALAFEDPERALGELMRGTLTYLDRRGLEAAPQTRAALARFEERERSKLSA